MKLGISACLLGERVRYDGGHKLDRYLHDVLGRYVEWVAVCPEVECGLPVPREAMRLVGNCNAPRMVTVRSTIDYTDQMLSWAERRVDDLEKERLCGYIFKSKSPSCGLERTNVYARAGMTPLRGGVGLFAREFTNHFPLLPVEDEGRLHDAVLRENFIERIFVYDRWQQMRARKPAVSVFRDFHQQHKLLIMAHSPAHLGKLGALAGEVTRSSLQSDMAEYIATLMQALKLKATVKKNTNVLMHIMGFFKKQLSSDEKRELLEVFDQYYNELIPLVAPLVLLQHYTRKYDNNYLKLQVYLHPHPLELKLRNHV